MLLNIEMHCQSDTFLLICVNVCSHPNLLPLTLALHYYVPHINNIFNNGAIIFTHLTLLLTENYQVLNYEWYVLAH